MLRFVGLAAGFARVGLPGLRLQRCGLCLLCVKEAEVLRLRGKLAQELRAATDARLEQGQL
eukprot:1033194-Alexandrium_andersonii.AAC.1